MEVMDVVQNLGRSRQKDVTGVGKVKFYDNSTGKQFGFLESPQGDVFFHGSRAVEFALGDGESPSLLAADRTPDGSMTDPPRRGDQVVFIAETGPRGLRAVKWAKWDEPEYASIMEKIKTRPKYRLVKRKGHRIQSKLWGGGDGKGFTVLWEGQNLDEVRRERPKSTQPTYDADDGALYFQVLNPETMEWEICDDPR